ncbi:ATP-binding cassette sub-family G member 1-like [Panonychus citri]|uniref:ATP-binding cassette sub-family G member 1-like n=1 Tax=Panonychus citri TaxID=50023 RepID=UPI0023081D20|nr:ATP-binding cassette sub-family G member 1-like [Panonychus citri]
MCPPQVTTVDENNHVAVVWRNLTVYKPMDLLDGFLVKSMSHKCRKAILRNISGVFRFHDLSAIMGPSGAGKTTLLQCLFGTWSGRYKGKIYRNPLANKASFITQKEEDHLFPCLSVIESIFYASRLKGAQNESKVVEELIDQLDLRNCRHTLVHSCSGGQRKRLVIAQELASEVKPKILFIDEPTSGLDSNVSFTVLTQLQKLCMAHGMAIIATIHQPSYKILKLFDQLYVLSRAGKCLYQGRPEVLRSYLSQFQVNCPNGHNPADVIIDAAAINTVCLLDEEEPTDCFSRSHRSSRSSSKSSSAVAKSQVNKTTTNLSSNSCHLYPFTSHFTTTTNNCLNNCNHTNNHNNCLHLSPPPTSFSSHPISYSSSSPPNGPASQQQQRKNHQQQQPKESTTISIVTPLDEKELLKVRLLEESSAKLIEFEMDSIDTSSMSEVEEMRENRNHLSLRHMMYLLRRSFLHGTCREPLWLFIRVGLHVNSAGYYYRPNCTEQVPLSRLREESNIDRNISYLFFNLLFLMFAALMPTVLTFPSEIKIFMNEHRNGWYSTASYYMAKTLTEFWIQLILPYLYSLFTYYTTQQIGLNSWVDAIPFATKSSRFNNFVSISILASYIAQGVGFFIGAIFTTNFNISIFVATVIMLFNFLFSGFFVRSNSMGRAQFITYLSFIRFAFEAILLTIYGQKRCHSDENGVRLSDSGSSFASNDQSDSEYNNVISVVMFKFELNDKDYSTHFTALTFHLILWRLVTFFILYCKVNPEINFRFPNLSCLSPRKIFSAKCCLYFSTLVIIISLAFIIFSVYYLITE